MSADDPIRTSEHVPTPEADPSEPPPTDTFDPNRTTGLPPPSGAPEAGVPGYELIRELGRGGMGVVYEARDTRLNRVVALKMILGQPGPADRARFRAEAEAMAAVKHPYVAQVFEAGEVEGRPFLVMELLSGGTLADRLRAGGPTPAAVAALVQKVTAGVAAAHAQGIVHRDLKPGNVLLEADGEPKVTDFGLAKRDAGSDLTATGAVMGTPAYMAPEQADGNTKFVGPAADVWSLGVILYEALTGTRPFDAPDARGVLARVLTADPVPPRKLAPQVPRDLELICLKCLEKAPHERYATAKELADDLGRYTRGEPISVRPLGRAERAVRWVRRHPTEAGLLAAIAVAVCALAGVVVALVYQDKLETANNNLASLNSQLESTNGQLGAANGELTAARDDLQRTNGTLAGKNKDLETTTAQLRTAEGKLKDLLAREEKRGYYNRVALAFGEWQRNDTVRTRQRLDDCPTALRGWEWHYVERLLAPRHRTLDTGKIGPLTYSPDGKWIAATYDDATVKLWDIATGKVEVVLRGHTKPVSRLVFSRDGKFLATAAGDLTVKVWDIGSGKEVCTLPGHAKTVHSVAFSPDGSRVATGDDSRVRVWDAATGKRLKQITTNGGSALGIAFHPTVPFLVYTLPGNSFELIDLQKPDDAPRDLPRSLPAMAFAVTFHPDGNRLVFGLQNGAVLFLEPVPNRPPVTIKAHAAPVFGLTFSPDGKRFGTSAADGTVKVWDATSNQELASVRVAVGPGLPFGPPASFAPGLTHVAANNLDGTVKFWPVTDDPAAALNLRTGTLYGVALSADGSRIAGGNATTGRFHPVYGLAVWEAATGRYMLNSRAEPRKDEEMWEQGPILGVAFSPAGDRVATAHATDWYLNPPEFPPDLAKWSLSAVKVWDVATGKVVLTLKDHTASVTAVAYTADGSRIVSASQDGTLRVWTATDGKPVATHTLVARPPEKAKGKRGNWPPEVKPVFGLTVFSRDGRRFAAATLDGTVRVWDVDAGKELFAFKPHEKPPTALAFAPDGRRLLTGGEDGVAKVWDESGHEFRAYVGHLGRVNAVALTPDGARVASGDGSGVVKLWDAETGQEAFSAKGNAGVTHLAFQPDGARLLIVGEASVKIWDARPVHAK